VPVVDRLPAVVAAAVRPLRVVANEDGLAAQRLGWQILEPRRAGGAFNIAAELGPRLAGPVWCDAKPGDVSGRSLVRNVDAGLFAVLRCRCRYRGGFELALRSRT